MNHLVILAKHLLSCDIDSDNVFLRSRELSHYPRKTTFIWNNFWSQENWKVSQEKWGINPLDSWLFRASLLYHSDPAVMWTPTVELSIFKK